MSRKQSRGIFSADLLEPPTDPVPETAPAEGRPLTAPSRHLRQDRLRQEIRRSAKSTGGAAASPGNAAPKPPIASADRRDGPFVRARRRSSARAVRGSAACGGCCAPSASRPLRRPDEVGRGGGRDKVGED